VEKEIAGAKRDAVVHITDAVRHGTARLPELHGLESTRHHYPFFHATHGEPFRSLLVCRRQTLPFGHSAPYQERVGQGRRRLLGTQAPTHTSIAMP